VLHAKLSLKEEGIYTIMINPNIATIATSKGLADKVYSHPSSYGRLSSMRSRMVSLLPLADRPH
jgi:carbamoylphosphate synthase large subunit